MTKPPASIMVFLLILSLLLPFSCRKKKTGESTSTSTIKGQPTLNIDQKFFGTLPDRREVKLFTLTNPNGLKARIMTYGATLVSLEVPDRENILADITLGHDTLEGYLEASPYFGSTVGRYANRIGGAGFTLEGKKYTLAANDGNNHLHGGLKGFDKVLWTAGPKEGEDFISVNYSQARRNLF